MNILVAGMMRSGSTLLFNMIVKIYKTQMPAKKLHIKRFEWLKQKAASEPTNDIVCTKTHMPSEPGLKWANLIFTTKRDIRDSCASGWRRRENDYKKRKTRTLGKKDEVLQTLCKQNIAYFNEWKKHTSYELVYERYMTEPLVVIEEVSKVLNLPINDPIALKSIYDYLEFLPTDKNLNDKKEHPETLLSKDHKTNNGEIGGYKKTLNKQEIKDLQALCKDWLIENGYPPSEDNS
jgi:hypothetical protein